MHVVQPNIEISKAEYSMDSMKRSMKSRCGDVFVVLRWCHNRVKMTNNKYNLIFKDKTRSVSQSAESLNLDIYDRVIHQKNLRTYFNYELKIKTVWGLIKLLINKLIAALAKEHTNYKLTNKANL